MSLYKIARRSKANPKICARIYVSVDEAREAIANEMDWCGAILSEPEDIRGSKRWLVFSSEDETSASSSWSIVQLHD